MSLSRSLPPADPDPALVALFTQPDRIPKAVLRQSEFFLFFARTVFPLLEQHRKRLTTVYTAANGRPAWDPVRLLGVLVLQFVLRVSDRQAAEQVQYDQRWRLALHLMPGEAAFDPSPCWSSSATGCWRARRRDWRLPRCSTTLLRRAGSRSVPGNGWTRRMCAGS